MRGLRQADVGDVQLAACALREQQRAPHCVHFRDGWVGVKPREWGGSPLRLQVPR